MLRANHGVARICYEGSGLRNPGAKGADTEALKASSGDYGIWQSGLAKRHKLPTRINNFYLSLPLNYDTPVVSGYFLSNAYLLHSLPVDVAIVYEKRLPYLVLVHFPCS